MLLFDTSAAPVPLTEKYRPRCLDQLVGQAEAVGLLRAFIARPYATSFLFEGDTGTGKTSAAFALAHELGCAIAQGELGGLCEIASGEQTADDVRSALRAAWLRPFYGSGWRVLIVNEADRMSPAAETIWLDALESLPAKLVIVFTTNHSGKLSPRFRDRCERVSFVSDWDTVKRAAQDLAVRIWQLETGRADRPNLGNDVVDANGTLSFRRVVQAVAKQVRLAGVA